MHIFQMLLNLVGPIRSLKWPLVLAVPFCLPLPASFPVSPIALPTEAS